MDIRVDKVLGIPSSIKDGDFFVQWLSFLRPLNHLTDSEVRLAAKLLEKRQKYREDIVNEDLIDELLFNPKTKKEIKDELKITNVHYQTIINNLKKKQVIIDNKINKWYIPKIKDGKIVNLLLVFKLE